MCSLAPHTDDTHYASVLSLNFNEEIADAQSGTAFWRSKEFQEEFVSSDKNYRGSRILNKINAYVNFDPSQYKSKDCMGSNETRYFLPTKPLLHLFFFYLR